MLELRLLLCTPIPLSVLFNIMNINLTLIGQMLSFGIFIWFCLKYVWPPLIKAMEDRQAKIAAGLRDAEKAEHDLKIAQNKAQETVNEAKEQAAKLIEHANKRANQMVEEARTKAREEGERLKLQAQSEIQQQLAQTKEALRVQVSLLAAKGAEKILQAQVDQKIHQKMLDQIAAEL